MRWNSRVLPTSTYGDPDNRSCLGQKLSDEELTEEVRRVALAVGKPVLKVTDYRKHSEIDYATVKGRFGDWRTVLTRAGLAHMYTTQRPRPHVGSYSDEALLEEVGRVAQLVDKPTLTTTDFDKHAGIRCATLQQRFGTWRKALERAGLAHRAPVIHRYSDEELLRELRRVAQLVGKPSLRICDFNAISGMDCQVVADRFGGWNRALERAGLGHMRSRGR